MPRVSIVIPTCNRSEYLVSMLDAILAQVPGAEVIVSDNSDTDALRERLAARSATGQVRYQFIAERVSVVENFERAVALATGDYVTCLGDDDCVGAGFLAVLEWASANEIDAVYSYGQRFIANYFWPGVKSYYFGDGYQARLFVRPYGGSATRIDPRRALNAAARTLGSGLGDMPRLYHGLVKRALLDRVRHKYGAIFGGVSPDIYCATLISLEAASVFRVDAPFILPGGSPSSTAGQGAAHTDRAGLFEVDHIQRFGPGLVWLPQVPAYYAPCNVWAYSMLCALARAGVPQVRPNYVGLLFKARIGSGADRPAIAAALAPVLATSGRAAAAVDLLCALCNEARSICRRLYWKFLHRPASIGELATIGDAVAMLNTREAARGFDLRLALRRARP